jgi:hypothetical protein
MFKSTAGQSIALYFYHAATGLPASGEAEGVTAYVNGTQLADTIANEVSSSNAPGWYSWSVTLGETGSSFLVFSGKCSTSGVVCEGQVIYTQPSWLGVTPGTAGGVLLYGTGTAQLNPTGGQIPTSNPTRVVQVVQE